MLRTRSPRHQSAVIVLTLLLAGLCIRPASLATIPDRVDGQEISTIYGWWAAIYSNWPFVPSHVEATREPMVWAEEVVVAAPPFTRQLAVEPSKLHSIRYVTPVLSAMYGVCTKLVL